MSRILFGAIFLIFVIAPTHASADDLPVAPLKPAKLHAAKAKTATPPATQDRSLGAVPFSDPYAPPVGAGKSAAGEFPAAKGAAPVNPKGGVSFILQMACERRAY
jgi:hypothetical protein